MKCSNADYLAPLDNANHAWVDGSHLGYRFSELLVLFCRSCAQKVEVDGFVPPLSLNTICKPKVGKK